MLTFAQVCPSWVVHCTGCSSRHTHANAGSEASWGMHVAVVSGRQGQYGICSCIQSARVQRACVLCRDAGQALFDRLACVCESVQVSAAVQLVDRYCVGRMYGGMLQHACTCLAVSRLRFRLQELLRPAWFRLPSAGAVCTPCRGADV